MVIVPRERFCMTPRTDPQNKRFHAMVRDIAKQVQWAGLWWDEDDWKKLVLGAKYGQVVAPNPFGHGLLVMNKLRSSALPKSASKEKPDEPNMTDLISEVQAFGDENGVVWSDPSKPPLECYERDREAA